MNNSTCENCKNLENEIKKKNEILQQKEETIINLNKKIEEADIMFEN